MIYVEFRDDFKISFKYNVQNIREVDIVMKFLPPTYTDILH